MESKKINQLATELAPDLSDLTIIGDPTTGISKKITLSQMASLFTGTVEEYANLAAFPLVGVADTIYIALDTNVIYRYDTSLSAYVILSPNVINSLVFSDANGFDGTITLVGSVATLSITTALTLGSVPFIGASGALTQDNSNLFFDDTNNRLGIATASPTTPLDVFGSGIIGRLNATSTNNSYLGFASNGTNKWSAGNVQSDHRFRIFSEANSAELITILQTGEFGIGISNPTTKFHIDGAASALIANLDANVSIAKSVSYRSDNSARINLEVSGTESGSNAGADFFLRTFTDAGSLLETPFSIVRSTGVTTIKSLTLTNALSVANGGTGSTTQNFVDLTTTQSIGGAKTFTSALVGTSATFTSSTNALTLSNTGNLWLRIERGSIYNNIGIDSVGAFYNTNSNHKFYVADGTINSLTLASTGAATFSSSVTIGSTSTSIGGLLVIGGSSIGTANANNGQIYLGATSAYRGVISYDEGPGYLYIDNTYNNASSNIYFRTKTSGTAITAMTILGSGNVGIGVTPGSTAGITQLDIGGAASNPLINGIRDGVNAFYIYSDSGGTDFGEKRNLYTRFITNNTERMRITSGGLFKFQNSGSAYESGTTGVNEFNTAANDTNVVFRNTAASLTASRAGVDVFYTAAAPNNTTACFYQAGDYTATRTIRFEVRSNGGIGNYSANNVNLSDERVKKDIVALESYWNKFKAIEIVKFKYKDQTHDDFNIGVIAQQVESIAPEFIDVDGWDNRPKLDEDGNEIIDNEEPLKSVYTSDLHHATIKVLQEAMARIEEHQSIITSLKEQINELKTK